MNDYSQFGEQAAITAPFLIQPGGAITGQGRVLDIGAWHPTKFSNSRALIEAGWEAVLIEPTPGNMINLAAACLACGHVPDATYGNRYQPTPHCEGSISYGFSSRITLLQVAVHTVAGLEPMYVSDDAISTGNMDEMERWKAVGGYYGQVYIPAITLEQIANQFGGFDVWNIDAEGGSAELFLQMLMEGHRPTVVCVEHDGRTTELLNAATAEGYVATLVNSTNIVVVRR